MRMLLLMLALSRAIASKEEQLQSTAGSRVSKYIIIMDAGSTGTRAHTFQYNRRVIMPLENETVATKPMTLPERKYKPVKFTPGISSHGGDIEALKKNIENIQARVSKDLAKYDNRTILSDVPVYLLATAGMRALNTQIRAEVFDAIRSVFREGPFSCKDDAQVRVLAGEEESAFGWLMVNHNHLDRCDISEVTSCGSLDMGGASAEIAFIPKDPSIMAHMFPMHFGPFPGSIGLYTHSFMDLGLEHAFQIATDKLKTVTGDSSQLLHPCLPKNLVWHVDKNGSGRFGVDTDKEPDRTNGSLVMTGDGNWDGCLKAAERIIDHGDCPLEPCSSYGIYQPSLENITFYLEGEFANIFDALVVPHEDEEDGQTLLLSLEREGRKFCDKDWHEQQEAMKETNVTTAEPALACWLGAWSYAFLVKGVGFSKNTTKLVVETELAPSWAEGAAIYHTNYMPYDVLLGHSATDFLKATYDVQKQQVKDYEKEVITATRELENMKKGSHSKRHYSRDLRQLTSHLAHVTRKQEKAIKDLNATNARLLSMEHMTCYPNEAMSELATVGAVHSAIMYQALGGVVLFVIGVLTGSRFHSASSRSQLRAALLEA